MTKKKQQQKLATKFENRICVFLDILGFKDHLDQAATDPKYVQRISGAFACVNDHLRERIRGLKSRRLSQYSDCVTISYRIDEPSSAYYLLSELQHLQIALAGRGFLVRGGVTVGLLVHDAGQLFGPAQVRAYELESTKAVYPRILVDDQVIEMARKSPAPHHNADDEERYLRGIVNTDFDEQLYIGYTTVKSIVDVAGADPEDYSGYMGRVLKIVEDGLKSADPRILAKMLWLYSKYLEALDGIKPEFHDTHFPNTLLPVAQEAYKAVISHVKENPRDKTKCALPKTLVTVLKSTKNNRPQKATGSRNR